MGFVNFRFLWLLVTVGLVLILQSIGTYYPWYMYNQDLAPVDNYTCPMEITVSSYLSFEYRHANIDPETCYWSSSCGMESVSNLWRIILASAVIAIFLTTVELLILVTWTFDFCKRLKFRNKLRVPLICVAVLAAAATFAAWLMLFAHGKALSDDSELHLKFAGDSSGPQAGWCLFVASSAISLHSAVVLAMSGSPDRHDYHLLVNDD